MSEPRVVLLFSGKRKSGKDYVTALIQNRIGDETCSILRLSGPLKGQYAKEHGLDYDRLLDASDYKEKYRADMIRWGEEKRNADSGYFCRLIASGPGSEKPVWIISDCRRKTDVAYFQQHYSSQSITVRVQATEEVRKNRGWTFTSGVDDAESECGLDSDVNFDIVINNNGDADSLEEEISKMCTDIQKQMLK